MMAREEPGRARVAEAQHVVASAVRWTNNIICEVVNNHGRYLTEEQRDALKQASSALSRFQIL